MHHFPWLRNRTTEHRKAGKARNTKENRRSKEFSTVSRQLVEHLSSANVNQSFQNNSIRIKTSQDFWSWEVFLFQLTGSHCFHRHLVFVHIGIRLPIYFSGIIVRMFFMAAKAVGSAQIQLRIFVVRLCYFFFQLSGQHR